MPGNRLMRFCENQKGKDDEMKKSADGINSRMNSGSPGEAGQVRSRGWSRWLGLIPIALIVMLTSLLAMLNIRASMVSPVLFPILNTLFIFSTYSLAAYFAARNFLRTGSWQLLLFGTGILMLGISATLAAWLSIAGGLNLVAKIHNVNALAASFLMLSVAAFAWKGVLPRKKPGRLRILISVYTIALAFVALVTVLALENLIPTFVNASGPTMLRQVIYGTAAAITGISAFWLLRLYSRSKADFLYWSCLGLMLITIGFTAGLFAVILSDSVSWLARIGLYFSGIYFIIAGLVARTDAQTRGMDIHELIAEFAKHANVNYEFLVNTASDAIIAVDNLGRILTWNPAAEKMFGYSRGEAVGSAFIYLLISPDDVDSYKKAAYAVDQDKENDGSSVTMELKVRRRNTEEFPVELRLASRKLSMGRLYITTLILRDITERKRAEEALQKSEQRWATTLASIGDAVISTDVDGRITFMNARAEELTGWMLAEAATKPITEVFNIINEYTFKEADNPVIRVLQEGTVVGLANHTILVKKDKTQVPIDDSGAPVRDTDGKIMGVVLVFRDITERKRAEEDLHKAHNELELRVQKRTAELKESNIILLAEITMHKQAKKKIEHLALFPELNPNPIIEINAEGTITFSNAATSQILKTLGIRDDARVFLPGDFEDIMKALKQEKEIQPFYRLVEVKDRIFSESIYVSKKLNVVHIYMNDITEYKKAEEKIREQAALIDKAQEAIGVRSLEHILTYWNKGAQRLYGWTAQEAIGKNPAEFLFKDNKEPPRLIEAKKIVLEKGEWIGELHQLTKEGKEVIVESHWTLIYDSEGKPKSILVVNTDITEKKMFESQLLRAQRMESIGILAGGIAHNLNNMLTPVMLSLQMLKGKFTDEHSRKLLSILENNSQRSADLIKQVLSFSQGVEGERNPLETKHIIFEIKKIAKETFPGNIEIRTDIPEDLITILGDATQLHQVIMNLCVNARDAMPDGGILTISAENFLVDENYARMHSEAKAGSYVAITVSDTGTGIPPDVLDRVFEPFFTTKEFGKGTGLGLSTSLAIVKSHGGFIKVHSEIGKGTQFSIYLPSTKTEIQSAQEQQLELLFGHGELILVVEDEDSVRKVTVSTLEKYGYSALAAEDGAEAVVLYARNKDKVRVILMDMMMPVMDGPASIRAIHKINPEVKVIAVSGLAEKDILEEVEDLANAFLPKPYTARKLLKTLDEVLSTR
ncbi:MAG: PAS domain S-box protein [Candidatus Methanoperedens sp.]|nr:PAS domain S-box protein [Candidatus Methanoperedens sp.]